MKAGKRNSKGRLIHTPKFDHGTERAQAMRREFGTYYVTAYGRMFASGLMGAQDEASARYSGLQRFLRLYGRVYGNYGYRCPLDQTPRGRDSEHVDPEQAALDRQWLRAAMSSLDESGCYPYLEQVISPATFDSGPAWLDRMIDVIRWNRNLAALNRQLRAHAKESGRAFAEAMPMVIDPRDQMVADAVNRALDVLAPHAAPRKVLAQWWDDAA